MGFSEESVDALNCMVSTQAETPRLPCHVVLVINERHRLPLLLGDLNLLTT